MHAPPEFASNQEGAYTHGQTKFLNFYGIVILYLLPQEGDGAVAGEAAKLPVKKAKIDW